MKLLQLLNEIEVHHQRTYIVIVNDKKIQVYPEDTSKGTINWYKADEQCRALPGQGWRLPTIEELKAMHKQLYVKGKGNFEKTGYWSSEAYPDASNGWGTGLAQSLTFTFGYTSEITMANDYHGKARAVRNI